MSSLRAWNRVVLALIFATMTTGLTLAQSNSKDGPVRIQKVVAPQGWRQPSFGPVLRTQSKPFVIAGVTVNVTEFVYEYLDAPLFELESFFTKSDGTLIVRKTTAGARSMLTFNSDGKEFGRQIAFTPATKENGKIQVVPLIFLVYYIDEDGDGILETRITNRSGRGGVPEWVVPDWLKAGLKK